MNQSKPPSTRQRSTDEQHTVEILLEQARGCLEGQPQETLDLLQRIQGYRLNHVQWAESFWLQAQCLIRVGSIEAAKPLLVQAIKIFDELNHSNQMTCRADLGRLYRDAGEFSNALELFDQSLTLIHQYPDPTAEANILNLSATVYILMGEPTEARERLERVLRLRLALNDLSGQAVALINLGNVLNDSSDYSNSLDRLIQAHQILQNLNNPDLECKCLINIGETHLLMEQPDQAIVFFEQAAHLSRLHQHQFNEILSLIKLAETHNVLKQHKKAKELAQICLRQARQAHQHYLETSILALHGAIHLALSETEEAQDYYGLALIQAEATNDGEAHFEALIGLGQTSLVLQDPKRAIRYLEEALELAERMQKKREAAKAHQHLSAALEMAGQATQALEHFKTHHQLEREILNEDTVRKTKNMTMQLDLERSRHEAETYRLRTQVFEEANAMLEEKVLERTRELEEARIEVVMRLAVAAEYRDDHTGQHTFRVGHTSALIARRLGVPDNEVETLRMAARLHDIGKIGIPDLIMLKPAKLSVEEFDRIKTHTTIGAQILSGGKTPLLRMAETIALTHHERWDGKGYPHGLSGEDIPLIGRIVSVADVFDALTSARPYKHAWSAAEARVEIEAKSGTQFDPQVVTAFTQLLDQGLRLEECSG
jgi:HD-GYP domain-containing protein (c-di-GMP phosphodiesterase class II)